jgi:nucleoside-diphosphate-sugar epimerase
MVQRVGRIAVHVLIIGAAGMVGRKFIARIAADPACLGAPVTRLTLADVVPAVAPAVPAGQITTRIVVGDLAEADFAEALVADRPDLVVHLAAVVSGEAEADFDKGYRVNFDGTRALFEAIRHAGDATGNPAGYCPRLVFSSTSAVFGAPFPDRIGDDLALTPLTSYGTQKAMAELLLADYSRRGFVDGIGIRLPTICVRPGAPNRAASGFFSNILREPLVGREAVLPVDDDVRHWFASPRAAVGFLVHAARLDTTRLGWRRTVTMPGLSATVGDEIAALGRVAGPAAVALIRREPDPTIARIVAGWPRAFDARRALELGFTADADMDAILAAHIEDELGGHVPGRAV